MYNIDVHLYNKTNNSHFHSYILLIAVFLIDAHSVLYLWFGWWPEQKNSLLREKNAFSGTAMSRWAQEKKLSLETALNYAKGIITHTLYCTYMLF